LRVYPDFIKPKFRQKTGMVFFLWAGILLLYNGPAIKGVCVPAFPRKSGMARVFAVMVQVLLSAGTIAVQV